MFYFIPSAALFDRRLQRSEHKSVSRDKLSSSKFRAEQD